MKKKPAKRAAGASGGALQGAAKVARERWQAAKKSAKRARQAARHARKQFKEAKKVVKKAKQEMLAAARKLQALVTRRRRKPAAKTAVKAKAPVKVKAATKPKAPVKVKSPRPRKKVAAAAPAVETVSTIAPEVAAADDPETTPA